jgi:hypothetical protein
LAGLGVVARAPSGVDRIDVELHRADLVRRSVAAGERCQELLLRAPAPLPRQLFAMLPSSRSPKCPQIPARAPCGRARLSAGARIPTIAHRPLIAG